MLGRLGAVWLGALAAMLLTHPAIAMEAAKQACVLWAENVLPALFPFMVLGLLLTAQLRHVRLSSREVPLFRLPISALPSMLLAFLGGSPAGARLIAAQFAQGRLTRGQAQRMAAFCATCSPMFLLGTVCGWLGDSRLGVPMLAAHITAALLTGFLFAPLCADGGPAVSPMESAEPSPTFGAVIQQASLAMLTVCGCMMLFMVLQALLLSAFPDLTNTQNAFLGCVLEMASGCARTTRLGLAPMDAAPWLCAAASFGGLSIFAQNMAFLRPAGVRGDVQFATRLVHAPLAYSLCRLFLGTLTLAAATPLFVAMLAFLLTQARFLGKKRFAHPHPTRIVRPGAA